jgi:hypothetical protein
VAELRGYPDQRLRNPKTPTNASNWRVVDRGDVYRQQFQPTDQFGTVC